MSDLRELNKRSIVCELCNNEFDLQAYTVVPKDEQILACQTCVTQIENPQETDPNHWRCLNDSMWSEHKAVQVIAWRMLTRLRKEGWPQDLLDMMYLEEEDLEWAKATGEGDTDEHKLIHRDSNGNILEAGDSVVLTKDLDVKGANFTAKRGAFMRNITLVHDNEEHIEGKINGQQVVIVTKWTKKSN